MAEEGKRIRSRKYLGRYTEGYVSSKRKRRESDMWIMKLAVGLHRVRAVRVQQCLSAEYVLILRLGLRDDEASFPLHFGL